MDQATTARYADLVVRSCLGVREHDIVAIHGEVAHAAFLRALADTAYRAGAALVDLLPSDPAVRASRIRHAPDDTLDDKPAWGDTRMRWLLANDASVIWVGGPSEPRIGADLDPGRSARVDAVIPGRVPYLRAVAAGTARFCVVAWAHPGWCSAVYPELDSAAATARVATDLARFCRMGPDDGEGTGTWDAHVARLERRVKAIDALRLTSLRLRGEGTDLQLALAPGTRFLSARETLPNGRAFTANLPTEELFTTPHAAATEGTFRCSRPLSLGGRMLEDLAGEFRNGRLVRLSARRDSDRDYLAAYLARHRNGDRLGEVALLDSTSRIGETGRTYGITLLDENVACHVAFGAGFATTRTPGQPARGINRSSTHIDVMVGTPSFRVTGSAGPGRRVTLIADGLWQGDLQC